MKTFSTQTGNYLPIAIILAFYSRLWKKSRFYRNQAPTKAVSVFLYLFITDNEEMQW